MTMTAQSIRKYEIAGQAEGNGFRVFTVIGPRGIKLKPIALKPEWFAGETEMHNHALQCALEQHEGLKRETKDYQNGHDDEHTTPWSRFCTSRNVGAPWVKRKLAPQHQR